MKFTNVLINQLPRKKEDGFTLIEILVVVLIIGIITAIAIPVFLNQRKNANDSAVESDVKNIANILQTLPPDSTNFAKQSVTINSNMNKLTYFSDGAVKTEPAPSSNGIWWTVTGDSSKYCIIGYHTNGNKYKQTSPLTYDSTAGGLGKTGEACNPADATDSNGVVIASGNLINDPLLSSVSIGSPYKGMNGRIQSYNAFPFQTATMTHPQGNKVITGTADALNQGIIFYQPSNSEAVPVKKAGETYTVSAYVKADAGVTYAIGSRFTDIGAGYLRETNSNYTATGGWDRVSSTVTTTTGDIGYYVGVQIRQTGTAAGKTLSFAAPQIERGSTMTVFTAN